MAVFDHYSCFSLIFLMKLLVSFFILVTSCSLTDPSGKGVAAHDDNNAQKVALVMLAWHQNDASGHMLNDAAATTGQLPHDTQISKIRGSEDEQIFRANWQ